jgi:hypothetical protein
MAMFVFFGHVEFDVGSGEPTFADFGDPKSDGQAERVDALANGVGVHAGVDERRHGHVAADAAEAVEVKCAHGLTSFWKGFYRAGSLLPLAVLQ